MIGEKALLELLKGAITEDYFSNGFLVELNEAISSKL